MPPETRLAAVLFGSFLLWLPALTSFLRGDLDAGSVGLRFGGAVAVVWAGIALVTGIVSGYRTEPIPAAEQGSESPRRRAVDRSASPAGDPRSLAEDPTTTSLSDASDG